MLHLFRRKKPTDGTVGGIAVWLGFITPAQLSSAVNVKQQVSREQLLGEILIANGYMTRHQLDRCLEIQRGLRGGVDNYAGMLDSAVATTHEGLSALGEKVGELVDSAERLTKAAGGKK